MSERKPSMAEWREILFKAMVKRGKGKRVWWNFDGGISIGEYTPQHIIYNETSRRFREEQQKLRPGMIEQFEEVYTQAVNESKASLKFYLERDFGQALIEEYDSK